MTRKVYRTAQGKMVDLGALQLRNENVRAVGNMGVNARGDLLDSMNRPISSRTKQTAKQYAKQTNTVSNSEVYASSGNKIKEGDSVPVPKQTRKPQTKKSQIEATVEPALDQEIPPPPEDFEDNFEKPVEVKSGTEVNPPATGLAAAIARARQVKQQPLKTPRQIAQESDGVRKL